jgi:hypothetical protein
MADEITGQEGASQRQPQSGPARMMSERMSIYYSNTAMVATSPRDISLFFGRYVPAKDQSGGQSLIELYEQQIYMTVQQAEDLATLLSRTVEAVKSAKKG